MRALRDPGRYRRPNEPPITYSVDPCIDRALMGPACCKGGKVSGITRKHVLQALGGAFIASAVPNAAAAASGALRGTDDRWLTLERLGKSPVYRDAFVLGGRFNRSGYNRLCLAFRDVRVDPSVGYVQIDPILIDGLWEIQRFYRKAGLDGTIVIISGFRTAATNEAVGGAAKSLHLGARAADFVVSGVEPRHTAAVARAMPEWLIGGVGEYPGHVHVDRGPRYDSAGDVRFWTGVDH